ncbi:MaoC dehydratase-like protein [Prauserella shujinwangii]|uniref:MaoC dehydratase-like protein n=1 Tax=Prauserella shujinwangii TaxID=1453103 RepID=A0A2T0M1H4_9PSEU|nr:MaoC family dehydratase N-terminal domain-containing protein [Prauserella shujinwangii]PRX50456.1 MaoC dehydratase-like protein [Prauserella shujinwangii]
MTTNITPDPAAIVPGTVLPEWRVRPTNLQLFRFSAVTWNAHRIHYDQEYARVEGYPNVLVQSHLHGAFLAEALVAWLGQDLLFRELSWRNKHYAVPGDELTVSGTVVAVEREAGEHVFEIDLAEHNQGGTLCAPGRAVVVTGGARR